MDRVSLRNGYTTGSCSAAAAKAAAMELVFGEGPAQVELILPEGSKAVWEVSPVHDLSAPSERQRFDDGNDDKLYSGYWKVQKDSGDDPDVTNGVWIYARASWISLEELERRKNKDAGYWISEWPQMYLTGGRGIGRVTLPGLSCPVGHYAINPVPRRMIIQAVSEVLASSGQTSMDPLGDSIICGYQDVRKKAVLIEIAIPAGVALAEKTFNPRLGITDGISVLGTTGILRPMSEEALLETIKLDIHMKTMGGKDSIIMTPGNYGENYLKEHMGIAIGEAVVCSNFVADAAEMLSHESVKRLLFVGHIGKLIKVASGMRNTHSKYGDGRMETLERITQKCVEELELHKSHDSLFCNEPVLLNGKDSQTMTDKETLFRKIRKANTTEEVVGLLKEITTFDKIETIADLVMHEIALQVQKQLMVWSGGKLEVEVIVFSSAHQIAGNTY